MSKVFIVTAPDGREIEVEGPDDGTPEQAIAFAKAQYDAGPSILDTLASLPKRAVWGTIGGVTGAHAAFADRQAVVSPEQLETYQMYPESPAAKAYFEEKQEAEKAARTHKVVSEELKRARPFGAENSVFDKVVGGTAESIGGSVIPTLALGAINPALGMATGLATNFALEAGGQWEEAKEKGATDEQISRSMGFGGAVSTALELPILASAKKLMEGAKRVGATEGAVALLKEIGKAGVKTMPKEWGQEQATQLLMDIEANASGWGDYTPKEMLVRSTIAGASGALMGFGMGAGARIIGEAKQKNIEAIQTKAFTEVVSKAAGIEEPEAKAIAEKIVQDVLNMPVDQEQADIERAAFAGKFADIPNTEYGTAAGAQLDAVFGVKQPDQGLVSGEVEARREDYLARGLQDTTPHSERIFTASNDPNVEGLRLGQMQEIPDGFVGAISGSAMSEQHLFPMEMAKAIVDVGVKLRDALGMQAPILFTLEQMPRGGMGRYYRMDLGNGRYAHVINPRELPSWKHGGNQTTLAEFTYALTHEFGHALMEERWVRSIVGKMAAAGATFDMSRLTNEINTQAVMPETLEALRQFAPTEADLVASWQTLVNDAKAGRISGMQLAERLWGPRKFAWGMAKTKTSRDKWDLLRAMENERAREKGVRARNIETLTAQDIAELISPEDPGYLFRFDEFMAEQFSRASYDRDYLKGTKIGEWFQSALAKLREFFGEMKDQGFIKPDVTFEKWLDEQTALGKALKKSRPRRWGKVKLSKELRAKQKAAAAEARAQREKLELDGELEVAEEPHPLPKESQVAVETSPQTKLATIMLETISGMLTEEEIKEVAELIGKGQTALAQQRMHQLVEREIKHDRQYIVKGPRQPLAWDKGSPLQPAYPDVEAAAIAGIDLSEYTPERIQEAYRLWQTMGFNSPYFKRWWRNGKLVDGVTGEPLRLWHGTGQVLKFFDKTLRGQETAAKSAKMAFFFSATPENPYIYARAAAEGSGRFNVVLANEADQRRAQKLRDKIEFYKQLRDRAWHNPEIVGPSGKVHNIPAHVWGRKVRETMAQLQNLLETAEQGKRVPTVRQYFVRMENPYVHDFAGEEWHDGKGGFADHIERAMELGHDGVIFYNARDPMLGTVYAVFEPEQIKDAEDSSGMFGPNDLLHWDKGNPRDSTMSYMTKVLDKAGDVYVFGAAINFIRRVNDSLVELQQRAATPLPNGELDVNLQAFHKITQMAEAFKNRLQYHGEQQVKHMWGLSPKTLTQIYDVLEEEWKGGKLLFALQGWDADPSLPEAEQIWGDFEDGGRDVSAATGKKVKYWSYAPTKEAVELLKKHGVDTTTTHGQEFLQEVLTIKQEMLNQFTELEQVLREKILHRWGMAPMVAAAEMEKLYQVMQKIRLSPFFPQGWYGKWTLSVEELKENTAPGERKWKLVRVEHYDSKTARDQSWKRWQEEQRKTKKIRVTRHEQDDFVGIPLQLPRNLLSQLAATGEFTTRQLEVMEEMMLPVGYEKLEQRYAGLVRKVAGGERDIVRNFANFIWHNANFIWKLKFKTEFAKVKLSYGKVIREWQRVPTAEGRAMVDMLERNRKIMERVQEYLLYPPFEFQALRQGVALVYLMYNVKTALMNFSTMLNTYAALTAEYGEVEGNRLYVKGLYDAARLYALKRVQKTGELTPADSEIVWAYDRAVAEGVVDQSYAFFLAGQANTTTHFQSLKKGYLSKVWHGAVEVGMFPFRMVEKANRMATMLMFFEAERRRGTDLEQAYQEAVMRTNLLQNAYNAANRSELFRGKKALMTMFMSYVQFMTWTMTGGYAKALAANLESRGLKPAHIAGTKAFTVKLWLMYMLLGGMFAGPGMEDLMEVVQLIWRKLYKTDARAELKNFIKDAGYDPDLVMHGLLSNFAGMDVSGSFSLGRVVPGVGMLNRSWDNPSEMLGALGVRMAGPFGGFTEDVMNALVALDKLTRGGARPSEVMKELPGELGAIGKAWDAYVLQQLNPGAGAGVLAKSGARLVEDPPGSGNFRDLTNWELIGMALNFNPAVLARSKEVKYWEVGEQIYWRTKQTQLLDARWKAINTQNMELLQEVDKEIQEFNDSLPETHRGLGITGKMKADSLKAHIARKRAEEAGRASARRLQPALNYLRGD